jgi:hypothetical protein
VDTAIIDGPRWGQPTPANHGIWHLSHHRRQHYPRIKRVSTSSSVAPLQGFGQFSCQKNTNGIFIIARVTENFGGGCSPACPCPCPCPCPSCCVPVPLRCARRPHCVQAYRDSTSWNMSLTLSAFPFISLFIVFSGNRPPSTPHMPFRTCRSFSGHNA